MYIVCLAGFFHGTLDVWLTIFRTADLHFTALPVEIAVVICGILAVTWFDASTNQRHSAFSIPHFTFRIPQFCILPSTPLPGLTEVTTNTTDSTDTTDRN